METVRIIDLVIRIRTIMLFQIRIKTTGSIRIRILVSRIRILVSKIRIQVSKISKIIFKISRALSIRTIQT